MKYGKGLQLATYLLKNQIQLVGSIDNELACVHTKSTEEDERSGNRSIELIWGFLFVTPYVMVFQDVYMNYDSETDSYQAESSRQKSLVKMEYFIDIVYFIEIIFNFVKKTRAHT